nr:peptidylprolyl isomerase [Candidatus Cloacimonadota bacterium]
MFRVISLLLIGISLLSCTPQNEENYVVAQVNNQKLYIDDLRANFSETEWENVTKAQKEAIIQDWIRLSLLSQEAENTEIASTPVVQNKIRIAEMNIEANALLAQKLAEIDITEEDLFAYYRMHKTQYQKTHKEYAVQRIYLKKQSDLDSAVVAIKATSFKDAALKYSQEPAGKNGGYLGFVSQSNFPTELWNVITKLKKYHFQSVETDDGIYIVRYYDNRDVETEKTFVEVRDEIYTILREQRKQETFDNLINDLRLKSEITISL